MTEKINYDILDSEEKPFANRLAWWIKENLNPSSVLDVGCGPGTYVYSMRDVGIRAWGLDFDDRVIGKPYLTHKSLFDMKTEHGEVVICLEVAEHIEHERSDDVVRSVVDTVDRTLIWTAAVPGQGGVGHINCQPKEFWEAKLAAAGLVRNITVEHKLWTDIRQGYHMGWFANNLMLFQRV